MFVADTQKAAVCKTVHNMVEQRVLVGGPNDKIKNK